MKDRGNRPILPVILAGGEGTRLWPISIPNYPKQFLALLDEYSFFQKTVKRLLGLQTVLHPLIVCGRQHLELTQSHLNKISVKPFSIIVEPFGRNTAPAVALVAMQQVDLLKDPILLVLPSDHIISDKQTFQQAILKAVVYAEQGKLVTFGIVPDQPDTNYGYVKVGDELDKKTVFCVEKFIEKPNAEKAKQYFRSGQHYWNSGIFMFRASVFLKELFRFEPDIAYCCELIKPVLYTNILEKIFKIPPSTFKSCPKKSIDYAVMEKTQNAIMMTLDVGWSDIGSWQALWKYHPKDSNENAIWGNVELNEVERSLIYVQDKPLSLKGIKNKVIINANGETFERDL